MKTTDIPARSNSIFLHRSFARSHRNFVNPSNDGNERDPFVILKTTKVANTVLESGSSMQNHFCWHFENSVNVSIIQNCRL